MAFTVQSSGRDGRYMKAEREEEQNDKGEEMAY